MTGKFFHSRRARVLAVSFTAAAFAVTGGAALKSHARAEAYRNIVNNTYQHAFAELTTAVAEMDAALQKSAYATSQPLLAQLCTELFGRAMSAQMAIGELPYGNVELAQTASFVAKVGDYAAALSKSTAAGGETTEEEKESLRALAAASGQLSQMLQDLQADIHGGTITLEDLEQAEARLAQAQGAGGDAAGSSFQDVEADFPEVPTLIYDGPFSEHLSTRRQPRALEGLEEVTQEEAKAAAAAFMGLKPEIFTSVSTGEGAIPYWGFSAVVDGGEVYLEVSRQGGKVTELMNSRPVGEASLTAEEGVQTARTFLAEQGYGDMEPSYYINQSNILTVNFAARQGEVLCYPDLIKVAVALDNGSIVGFEADGYLMNHAQRTLEAPAVLAEEAQAVLDPALECLSHQLAIIPTGGKYEVLCHEFKCRLEDGRHYIVYVNAQTGSEEKILLLIEDESGTLTI